jgi:hypothetical protein
MQLSRRAALAAMAGFVLTPEGLWERKKMISIPQTLRRTVFLELQQSINSMRKGLTVHSGYIDSESGIPWMSAGVIAEMVDPNFREILFPGIRAVCFSAAKEKGDISGWNVKKVGTSLDRLKTISLR